ncbi:MAG TPA: hypothetical protein DCM87_12610 [Planctomycetes bacterium]|nr:hypothetical protein [Planctomycetota bacterium]
MLRIALLNFAFFLLGAGLGIALCTVGRGDVRPFQDKPAPRGVAATTPAPRVDGAAAEAAPLPRETSTLLAEALAALPIPKVESGSGTIKGTVKLENGSPIAGVVVRGWPQPSDRGAGRRRATGVPEDEPLEKYVARLAEQHQRNKLARVEATSDARGAFTLTGLTDAKYRLEAFLSGYEVQRSGRQSWLAVKPGSEVEFVAELITEIPVSVVFADGTSPAEANIEWERQSGGSVSSSSTPWTPENPAIQLNPGTYKLRATSGKDGEFASEEREVTMNAGGRAETVTLTLRSRPGIRGVVKFSEGEEPDNAVVWIARIAPGSVPDWESLRQSGEGQEWVGRHNDFAFAFEDLAAGAYAIGAARGHNAPIAVVEHVQVADAIVLRDLAMPALDPADYVIVWVYGPENEPLRDAQISGTIRSKTGSSSGGGSTIARPDGSYWFLPPDTPEHMRSGRENGDGDVQRFIAVHTQRFGAREVEYEPARGAEVVVRFVAPAEIEVAIPNYAGSGLEGKVNVGIDKTAANARGDRRIVEGKVDFEGKKKLGPLEPGDYEVVMYVQGERVGRRPVARQPVTLAAGMNSASFAIPPLYTVTVIVPEGTASMRLQLQPLQRREAFWGGSPQAAKDGRATFPLLAPGEYKLRSWGAGTIEEMRIDVQGDMEVRFEPKPVNALQVSLREEEGYLSRAGFQDGDLIVGIAGKDIENLAQLQAAMLMNTERVSVTVQRGSGTVELTIEPRKMMENEKGMGGELEPTTR